MNKETKIGTYGIDWANVDLNSAYESSRNILEPYTFDDILLECEHNIRGINTETVKAQFEEQLQCKIREARETFADNLKNIVEKANEYRNEL